MASMHAHLDSTPKLYFLHFEGRYSGCRRPKEQKVIRVYCTFTSTDRYRHDDAHGSADQWKTVAPSRQARDHDMAPMRTHLESTTKL